MTKSEIAEKFARVGEQPDEYLNYCIRKTQQYMVSLSGTRKYFHIIELYANCYSGIKKNESYVLFSNKQGIAPGAIIYFKKSGDAFFNRAIIAHELGHIVLHFETIKEGLGDGGVTEKQEAEATYYAELLLKDRSAFYKKIKKNGVYNKKYTVPSNVIKRTLKDLCPDYKDENLSPDDTSTA